MPSSILIELSEISSFRTYPGCLNTDNVNIFTDPWFQAAKVIVGNVSIFTKSPIPKIVEGKMYLNLFKRGSCCAYNTHRRESVFRKIVIKFIGINLPQGDPPGDMLQFLPGIKPKKIKGLLINGLINIRLCTRSDPRKNPAFRR